MLRQSDSVMVEDRTDRFQENTCGAGLENKVDNLGENRYRN